MDGTHRSGGRVVFVQTYKGSPIRYCLKTRQLITAEIAEGAEFKTRAFQSTFTFSACSAVEFGGTF